MQRCPTVVGQSLGCDAGGTARIHFPSGNHRHTSHKAQTRDIYGYGDQTSEGGVCICWKRVFEHGAAELGDADLLPVMRIALLKFLKDADLNPASVTVFGYRSDYLDGHFSICLCIDGFDNFAERSLSQ